MSDIRPYVDPARRHDFLLLFDVVDGNPNGDPDAGNLPRVDPETMHGLVTDVCLKRKVRNFITLTQEKREGYRIYVNDQGIALNTLHQEAYEEAKIKSTGKKQSRSDIDLVRDKMCQRFFDIRMFGAVMTTGTNAGQVRGPIQLTFARSVDPIIPLDVSITRVAITKAEDAEVVEGDDSKGKTTEMGRKPMIPYGLYIARGFFSAPFAKKTGVTEDDLDLFWKALVNMWDFDRSASRGFMACRGLHVFTHTDGLGNAPANSLFEKVVVKARSEDVPARRFADYAVNVSDNLPAGVTLTTLVGD